MSVTKCPHCGAENPSEAAFCASCHAILPGKEADRAAEPIQQATAVLDQTIGLAGRRGRDDLQGHLQRAKERIGRPQFPVVVVGEFKRGKSTLVNALLQRAVCPVDVDLVTAVPTTVRWAEKLTVTAHVRSDDGDALIERPAPPQELELLITEEADPDDPERERFVEIGLPHRMLRTGLQLVDTPGVGGLDSAHGFLTLAALRNARGVLFVTDAAQELTGPELEFLATTVQRCPRTVLVITKIDLYRQWRRIADLDRRHLERAGLDLPIIPVSSFLRLRASRDQRLNAESGFAELIRFLAREVVAEGRAELARTAVDEVRFVTEQLSAQVDAEQAALTDSTEAVQRLDLIRRQASRLTSPTATWQQTLADGVADLVADVEHDLAERLRTVLHDAEVIIEEGDPQPAWDETEAWLRRQVALAAVGNRDLLSERTQELATDVAEQFDLQYGEAIEPQLVDPGQSLDSVELAPAESLRAPGGKLAMLMTAARSSLYLPMMAGSVAAAVLEIGPAAHLSIAGISAVLGVGIGRKIIADERQRQLTYRQQQATAVVRKFIDEVAFSLNKQTRDGLRATQRRLRDEFGQRAWSLQRSATEGWQSASGVRHLDPEQRTARQAELTERTRELDSVGTAARRLVDHG